MTDEQLMRRLAEQQRNVFPEAFARNWSAYFEWRRKEAGAEAPATH